MLFFRSLARLAMAHVGSRKRSRSRSRSRGRRGSEKRSKKSCKDASRNRSASKSQGHKASSTSGVEGEDHGDREKGCVASALPEACICQARSPRPLPPREQEIVDRTWTEALGCKGGSVEWRVCLIHSFNALGLRGRAWSPCQACSDF